MDEVVDLFCIVDINAFGLSTDPTTQPHAIGVSIVLFISFTSVHLSSPLIPFYFDIA